MTPSPPEARLTPQLAEQFQADRDQIRATLYDADLSEGWLRAKLQQLLDVGDAQHRALDAQVVELRELQEALAELHDHCRVADTEEAGAWLERVELAVRP